VGDATLKHTKIPDNVSEKTYQASASVKKSNLKKGFMNNLNFSVRRFWEIEAKHNQEDAKHYLAEEREKQMNPSSNSKYAAEIGKYSSVIL